MTIIVLRGRDYDRRPRRIIVEHETAEAWWGKPVDHEACPTLQWPKFAWEAVEEVKIC